MDETATDRTPTDQAPRDRRATDRRSTDQTALDQTALDQTALDQTALDQTALDQTVAAAARALGRATKWDLAVALIDAHRTAGPRESTFRDASPNSARRDTPPESTPPDTSRLPLGNTPDETPDETDDLSLLRRDLMSDRAFWTSTSLPDDEPGPDGGPRRSAHQDGAAWASRWSHARSGYTGLLRHRMAGRDVRPAAVALRDELERLREQAPHDDADKAVRFHLGLVLENLLGDSAAATPHWTAAADSTADDTAASALRHLGGQRADAGDEAGARDLWWRSFRLRAAAGDVPGALAQLALLAPSVSLAEAVAAWADAAGLVVLRGRGLAGPPEGDPTDGRTGS